jgi:transposase
MKPEAIRCSVCESRNVVQRGKVHRRFRGIPIGRKPVWILMAIQRLWCLACGVVRQVNTGFSDSRRSHTRAFGRYALDLCRSMTLKDVARHLNVRWDMISILGAIINLRDMGFMMTIT